MGQRPTGVSRGKTPSSPWPRASPRPSGLTVLPPGWVPLHQPRLPHLPCEAVSRALWDGGSVTRRPGSPCARHQPPDQASLPPVLGALSARDHHKGRLSAATCSCSQASSPRRTGRSSWVPSPEAACRIGSAFGSPAPRAMREWAPAVLSPAVCGADTTGAPAPAPANPAAMGDLPPDSRRGGVSHGEDELP